MWKPYCVVFRLYLLIPKTLHLGKKNVTQSFSAKWRNNVEITYLTSNTISVEGSKSIKREHALGKIVLFKEQKYCMSVGNQRHKATTIFYPKRILCWKSTGNNFTDKNNVWLRHPSKQTPIAFLTSCQSQINCVQLISILKRKRVIFLVKLF